jgi:hypothetical protein
LLAYVELICSLSESKEVLLMGPESFPYDHHKRIFLLIKIYDVNNCSNLYLIIA